MCGFTTGKAPSRPNPVLPTGKPGRDQDSETNTELSNILGRVYNDPRFPSYGVYLSMHEQSDVHNAEVEQKLINQFAHELIVEQRRARRWRIFFKLFFSAYLLLLLLLFYKLPEFGEHQLLMPSTAHTALIEINGVINSEHDASADNVVSGLRAAFESNAVKGVILRINSPGGSPVQAAYIHDEILRLKKQHPETPVHAVITDICTSGGYYIASAVNNIYANQASLVGSIGVIMAGFGFVNAMDKLGIERRVLHAGENKSMLDPFSPLQDEHVAHFQQLIDDIHVQFRDAVIAGRGERLQEDEDLFSGLIWTGAEAVKLGLVDELRSSSEVAREIIGAADIRDYTVYEDVFQSFVRNLGTRLLTRLLYNLQWH